MDAHTTERTCAQLNIVYHMYYMYLYRYVVCTWRKKNCDRIYYYCTHIFIVVSKAASHRYMRFCAQIHHEIPQITDLTFVWKYIWIYKSLPFTSSLFLLLFVASPAKLPFQEGITFAIYLEHEKILRFQLLRIKHSFIVSLDNLHLHKLI